MSRFIFVLFFAVWSFISTPAFAEGTDARFVREVSLSKGNWLWHHYQRMSVEYRRLHTWKSFMESDACFHSGRKCTNADWHAVSASQKILIPAEGLLVRVRDAGEEVGVKLSIRSDIPTLRTLSLSKDSGAAARATELEKHNHLLVLAEGTTAKRYYDLKEREFFDRIVVAGVALIVGIFMTLLVMLPHVRRVKKANEYEYDDSLLDPVELHSLSEVLPVPADRRVPQTTESPAPSLPNWSDSIYPRSETLVFRSFDETSGTGHAVIKSTERVFLINNRTQGFTNQFRPGEEFQAVIVSPRYVERILIRGSPEPHA